MFYFIIIFYFLSALIIFSVKRKIFYKVFSGTFLYEYSYRKEKSLVVALLWPYMYYITRNDGVYTHGPFTSHYTLFEIDFLNFFLGGVLWLPKLIIINPILLVFIIIDFFTMSLLRGLDRKIKIKIK